MSEFQTQGAESAEWFRNIYECSRCGNNWEDEWSCTCNDRCPQCNAEIEAKDSVDLSRSLTAEDFRGAGRLIRRLGIAPVVVTDEDAKDYAEAMLEGGPHRFEYGRTSRLRRNI